MTIIKLTVKDHCVVRADSSPDVPVNEFVEIPHNHYGEFYIRLCHGKKGILVPSSPFPAGWEGVPTITLVNNSGNDLELRSGDEIGELHLRYNPPSPFQGKDLTLPSPVYVKQDGDKIRVIDNMVRMFECEELIQWNFTGHTRLSPGHCLKTWSLFDYIQETKPPVTLINYRQLPNPSEQDLIDAGLIRDLRCGDEHLHHYTDNRIESGRAE